jgi:hypothetical protein
LKQTRMILQTNLQHAQEQLKESEAREQRAHEARSEAADELPQLMAKFKSEREAIRAELTKVGVPSDLLLHLLNLNTTSNIALLTSMYMFLSSTTGRLKSTRLIWKMHLLNSRKWIHDWPSKQRSLGYN